MNRILTALSLACVASFATQIPGEQANACVSIRPAQFTGTKGYVGEASRKGQLVHLLAYQNDVINLASRPRPVSGGTAAEGAGEGNAMLLPIPAKPGSMTRFNVVNSSTCPRILKDMAAVLTPTTFGAMSAAGGMAPGAPAVQVFDSDIYTIVLAKSAKDIPAALSQVPVGKRPAINSAIFDAYARWYPGWTFALCCFNTTKKTSARPLIWWYQPLNPDRLFFPAIDAHDGHPPDLKAQVPVDHALAVGSTLVKFKDEQPAQDWRAVQYSDPHIAPEVLDLLPKKILGEVYSGLLPQGDFVFKTSDVRSGKYSMKRELPPGARKS